MLKLHGLSSTLLIARGSVIVHEMENITEIAVENGIES
jgi:hypothetical protein